VADAASLELDGGLRVVWDDLAQVRAGLTSAEPSAGWSLDGELGASHAALRVLTGATSKGSILLIAGARPKDAGGHDAEQPRALLVSGTGEVTAMDESLVSTQYDAAGKVERLGLELYAEGDDYPLRGAGDVTGAETSDDGALRRERTTLAFRLDGEAGTAILDLVYP
jgi:hypothetical protein